MRSPLVVCIVGHDAILQFVGVSQLRSTSLEWYGQIFQLLTIAHACVCVCVCVYVCVAVAAFVCVCMCVHAYVCQALYITAN